MPTNPYIIQEYSGEQNLVEDITIEIIKTMGRDVVYVPRQFVNIDKIFGEDIATNFGNSYSIEAYVDSWKGFNGTDIVNQFGIEVKDKVSLTIAKKRFEQTITSSNSTITRPREGDLIYFPLSKSLFEINFVEHESPFYPLGKRYSYFLTCEMFSYSMEKIATGNTAIDEIYKDSYRTFFDLTVGSFTGGTAFYEGQNIQKITGATGYGEVIKWNAGASMLTINIISGTFSSGSTLFTIADSANKYPVTTLYVTGITANTNRYMSYGPSKTLKGNNEDFEAERFKDNIVPFNIKNPFSEGSC